MGLQALEEESHGFEIYFAGKKRKEENLCRQTRESKHGTVIVSCDARPSRSATSGMLMESREGQMRRPVCLGRAGHAAFFWAPCVAPPAVSVNVPGSLVVATYRQLTPEPPAC